MTDERRTLARGVAVNLAGILVKASRAFYLLLFSRVLGVESFGLYVLAFAVQEAVSKVAILGLNWGSMRVVGELKAAGRDHEIRPAVGKILVFTLAFSSVTALLLALGAEAVGEGLFGLPALARPLRLFCLGMPPLCGMFVLTYSYRPSLDMRYELYVRSVIEPVGVLLFGALFLAAGRGLDGAVLAHVIAAAAGFAAALFLFARLYPRSPGPAGKVDAWMLFHSSAGMGGMEFLTTLKSRIDLMVLSRFLPLAHVGIYGAVIEIGTMLKKFRSAFDPILMPLSQSLLLKQEKEKLREQLALALGWSLQIGLAVFGVILLAPGFLVSLFGPDFVRAGVGTVLAVFSLGQLFHMSLGLMEGVLAITGFAYVTLVNMAVLIGLNFVLLLALVPSMGMAGAALATAVSYVFVTAWRFQQARRLLGINPLAAAHLRILLIWGAALLPPLIWKVAAGRAGTAAVPGALLFAALYGLLLKVVGTAPPPGGQDRG